MSPSQSTAKNAKSAKTPRLVLCALCVLCGSILAGCLSRGKAKEAHVSFGIAPIFRIEKDTTGASLTDTGTLKEATGRTKVQILSFEYISEAKDLEVKFDPRKP